ncbi:MAG: SBBP repeat-containing protein [Bacteroidia bacterium]
MIKPIIKLTALLLLTGAGYLPANGAKILNGQASLEKVKKNKFYIENKGQWDKKAAYLIRTNGLDGWVLSNGNMLLDFYEISKPQSADGNFFPGIILKKPERAERTGHRIIFQWQNNEQPLLFKNARQQEGYYNYLIGNDLSKHASYVGLFGEITGYSLYPGIDMRYYSDKGSMRYDLIVRPGSDPSQIKLKITGADAIRSQNGAVFFKTSLGEIQMNDLYVYEKETKKQVSCNWIIKNDNELIFSIGDYDKSRTLVIDPVIFSTYLGGGNADYGYGFTIDSNGNSYITGSTMSQDFDVTPGAYQSGYGGGSLDIFITKLNPTGTSLIYSTFIGGAKGEYSFGIAVNGNGNSFITGSTYSTDFDLTPGAFQTTADSVSGNAFVLELNLTGTMLVYSTLFGGATVDVGNCITLDANNNAYVGGTTNSLDFDITPGAFQTTYEGNGDAFITKVNSTGDSLIYSSYLGGSLGEIAYDVNVDNMFNVYLTGITSSLNFDVTTGAYQTSYGGNGIYPGDVFITKMNPAGNALIYSTYLGGSDYDTPGLHSSTIDSQGNIYLTGFTASLDFDTTAGAYQTTHAGGSFNFPFDVFVIKLNPTGTALVYSTYLGGSGEERAYTTDIDNSGNVYVTGRTNSTDFDVTPSAYQPTGGLFASDAFITVLNPAGSSLVYSTYLGQDYYNDEGACIIVNANGSVYLLGLTESPNFPITPGAYQDSLDGSYDIFVMKFDNLTSVGEIINTDFSPEIFPNPNEGIFTVRLNSLPKGFTGMEIINVLGEIVWTGNFQNSPGSFETQFDVSTLGKGIYFLKIQSSENPIVKKIVIE